MRMKTLRRLRSQLPKHAVRRGRERSFDISDATMEPDAGPAPEAVFDRITGPYGRRSSYSASFDEET